MAELSYSGTSDTYLADNQTTMTVNLAIRLNRPILVEGEPGCGKTKLASAVADEFGLELVKITVRSTSRAQDLLYYQDSLRRLQDSQGQDPKPSAKFIYPYIYLGPLGQAIHAPNQEQRSPDKEPKRRVVLIDEIDKADIDFPNDLLGVLDNFEFTIDPLSKENDPEELEGALKTKGFAQEIKALPGYEPIVIITSNREKRLPEPFLRRCLYVRILFPKDRTRLRDIVLCNLNQAESTAVNDTILDPAIEAFLRVRSRADKLDVQKHPTTSELIDWVRILHYEKTPKTDITATENYPPLWHLLFKTMYDTELYGAGEKEENERLKEQAEEQAAKQTVIDES